MKILLWCIALLAPFGPALAQGGDDLQHAELRAHAPPAPSSYVPSARAWDRQKIYDAIERQAAAGNWTLERKRAVQNIWDQRIARDHMLLAEKRARERAAGKR